jgi:hypothetical protein
MTLVLVILVALVVAIGGTFIFGPLLLLVALVVLVVGLLGARWSGRRAGSVGEVAARPGATLGAPDPKELTRDANGATDAAAAREARDRTGTT